MDRQQIQLLFMIKDRFSNIHCLTLILCSSSCMSSTGRLRTYPKSSGMSGKEQTYTYRVGLQPSTFAILGQMSYHYTIVFLHFHITQNDTNGIWDTYGIESILRLCTLI